MVHTREAVLLNVGEDDLTDVNLLELHNQVRSL